MNEKKPSDDAGYYMGWYVAYGLAISFAVYFFWQVKSVDFCIANEENCFREWVSALGGWAAVVAAVPTILYLSRQVTNESTFNRVAVEMQVQPQLEAAAWAATLCATLHAEVDEEVRKVEAINPYNQRNGYDAMIKSYERVIALLERDDLRNATTQFKTFSRPEDAVRKIRVVRDMLEEVGPLDPVMLHPFVGNAGATFQMAKIFLAELEFMSRRRLNAAKGVLERYGRIDH